VLGIEHILCDYSFFGRLDASTLLCAKNLLWWHLYSYYDPFISLGFLFLFFSDCEYLFIYEVDDALILTGNSCGCCAICLASH